MLEQESPTLLRDQSSGGVIVQEAGYHFGSISRETAEQILYDLGSVDGMFLVRDSTATDSVLSLCHNQSILHYRVSKIASTGQVILHGTPIQVFPDFDTLILKVQGLAIRPSIPCDRSRVNSLYSVTHQRQNVYRVHQIHPQQQQQQQQSPASCQQQIYAPESFYGTHIHYHLSHNKPHHHNNRSLQQQHQITHYSNSLNSSRSSSMWRLPLPEIKEAIIKKTKELGDELLYDGHLSNNTSSCQTLGKDVKLISENMELLKEIKLMPPSATTAGDQHQQQQQQHQHQDKQATDSVRGIVHQIELTSISSGAGSQSTLQRKTTSNSKQCCTVCHKAVRVFVHKEDGSPGGGGTANISVQEDVSLDEGLKCRSCCRLRHFKCDSLSRLEFSCLRSVSRRYICSSCLDVVIKVCRKECPEPSIDCMPATTTAMTTSSSLATDASQGLPSDPHDGKKGFKETEVIPSKEEMKQMIREVVDDVIRSTISQVIHQKGLITCPGCSGSESSGSGCECKVLPSVTSLDKQAEEETKTAKSEDLLLLLKSPDVEVKHFPSCKSVSRDDRQIVSSRDIELKKKEILDFVNKKSESSVSCSSSSDRTMDRRMGNHKQGNGNENETSNCVVGSETQQKEQQCESRERNSDHESKYDDDGRRERDDLQEEMPVEIGEQTGSEMQRPDDDDDDEDADDYDDDADDDDDEENEDEDGEDGMRVYESIRFDRQDLESKACLGFAQLDPMLDDDKTQVTLASGPTAAAEENVAHVLNNGPEDQSDIRSANQMPIKLNQLDLICLEEENQEKIQEMVRMYKKGPISLDPKFITLRNKIGSGFFGEVYLATIPLRNSQSSSRLTTPHPSSSHVSRNASSSVQQHETANNNATSNNITNYIQVAVKVLKDASLFNSRTELMKEASVMASLDHKHIIRLIGIACDDKSPRSPFLMVLELAPLGPMISFLQSPAGQQSMSIRDILVLMLQVSMGMQYLESKNYVHRDLAARNVLLVNESFAKISDFGMSRALGIGKDYYRAKSGSKWPLKWFAPECIYYFKFSSKSDVWAFGVTLWESLSYGARPYDGLDSVEILRFLNGNGKTQRLPPPSGTPSPICDLLTKCWAFRPEDRPSFAEIVQSLTSYLFLPSASSASCSVSGAAVVSTS